MDGLSGTTGIVALAASLLLQEILQGHAQAGGELAHLGDHPLPVRFPGDTDSPVDNPMDMEFGPDGALYVTNNSISGGEGEVVKIVP